MFARIGNFVSFDLKVRLARPFSTKLFFSVHGGRYAVATANARLGNFSPEINPFAYSRPRMLQSIFPAQRERPRACVRAR